MMKISLALLIPLCAQNVLSQTSCSGVRTNWPAASEGTCFWQSGNDIGSKTYPSDFTVLNEVEIYQCPNSGKRVIISNGIPDHDVITYMDKGICEINWVVEMPLNPTKANSKTEIPMRGIIAIALNGVPSYGAQESDSLNAVEGSAADQKKANFWYGHAGQGGIWHIHYPFMGKQTASSGDLLGYAMDGFPIYGPVSDSEVANLDGCNGRTVSGNYQYHVLTLDQVDGNSEYCNGNSAETNWNYILGCYSGSVASTRVLDSTTYSLAADCSPDDEAPAQPTTSSPASSPDSSPTGGGGNKPTRPPRPPSSNSSPAASPTVDSDDIDSAGKLSLALVLLFLPMLINIPLTY